MKKNAHGKTSVYLFGAWLVLSPFVWYIFMEHWCEYVALFSSVVLWFVIGWLWDSYLRNTYCNRKEAEKQIKKLEDEIAVQNKIIERYRKEEKKMW